MKYKRILLKLSGEVLTGNNKYGIDYAKLSEYAKEIKDVITMGVQIAIVIGGGNIFRGLKGTKQGIDRVQGDYIGMLATIINGMALQSALENINVKTKLLSAISIDPVCESMSRKKAIKNLENGNTVIISGGTGNPFFTTDSAAALRAIEIKADVILKATRVDGVYTADPEKDKTAVKYETLSFEQAYEKKLNIMDMTAFTLCKENNLPVIVFNINEKNNLKKIISGKKTGTIIKN